LGYLYNQERLQSAVDVVDTDSLIPAKTKTQEPTQTAPQAPLSLDKKDDTSVPIATPKSPDINTTKK